MLLWLFLWRPPSCAPDHNSRKVSSVALVLAGPLGAGDTVLDPFLGNGSTTLAAIRTGRNSIGNEIEPKYLDLAQERIAAEAAVPRLFGARKAVLI